MEVKEEMKGFKVQPYHRKALKSYMSRMSRDNEHHLWDDYVGDVLKQQGFSGFIDYPQSIYHVEELFTALERYSPIHAPRIPMSEHLKAGIDFAKRCFCPNGRPKIHIEEFTPRFVYSITSNHQGSSGLTALGVPKAESYVRAYERGVQILHGEKHPEPCIAYTRTQRNKTRLVWGFPYSMTAVEGILARPLIELYKEGITPMAFGMASGALGTRLMTRQNKRKWAYCLDVSKFDSSASGFLINVAFDLISEWFYMDEVEPKTGVTVQKIMDTIRAYFVTTPIVMPDGNVYYGKRHGVPSGSYFTQIVDSIINIIYVATAADFLHLNVSYEDVFVLGDDIIFFSDSDVSLYEVSSCVERMFKVTCHPDKCGKYHYSEPIKYLGRYWSHGIPDLPLEEIMGKMTQPERFRVYSKETVRRQREIRLLFLAYANTYASAYTFVENMLGSVNRALVTQSCFEAEVFGERAPDFPEDHLSGLMRYQIKYEDKYLSKSLAPLALMFWK